MAVRPLEAMRERIDDTLGSMSPRDRTLLAGLVVFAVLAVVLGGGLVLTSTLRSVRSRVESRAATLASIEAMAEEHADAAEESKEIEAELGQHKESLSAFLEQAAGRANVGDRLESVREKSTSANGPLEEKIYSVTLNNLTLEELRGILYDMETSGYPLKVKTLKVKTNARAGDKVLSVSMDVAGYRLIEEPAAPTDEG